MAHFYPAILTHPLRNKVCIFPTEDDCELSATEINSIIRRNPYSFNNIFYKPYIKRLEGDKKFKAIKRQYLKFKKNNIIKTGENPSFYIYNIIDNDKNQYVGIVGQMAHKDYDEALVNKIEKSAPEQVNAKFELIKNTGFIAKPITVVHKDIDEINQIIKKYKSKIPLYEFTRTNGFIHEVWQVSDPDDVLKIVEAFDAARQFFIIDDNNEFEALHQIYKEKNQQADETYSGQEAFNFFPAFLISQNRIKIHEYKKGFPVDYPKELDDILNIIDKNFNIVEIFDFEPPEKGEILFYAINNKFKLTPKKHLPGNLPDSVLFEKYILPEMSHNEKLIKQSDLKYCDGKRSAKCVDNQLKKGNCKFGFIIAPMNMDEIEYAAKQQTKIPYKSLYLEPRPLKGLFIYEI